MLMGSDRALDADEPTLRPAASKASDCEESVEEEAFMGVLNCSRFVTAGEFGNVT